MYQILDCAILNWSLNDIQALTTKMYLPVHVLLLNSCLSNFLTPVFSTIQSNDTNVQFKT